MNSSIQQIINRLAQDPTVPEERTRAIVRKLAELDASLPADASEEEVQDRCAAIVTSAWKDERVVPSRSVRSFRNDAAQTISRCIAEQGIEFVAYPLKDLGARYVFTVEDTPRRLQGLVTFDARRRTVSIRLDCPVSKRVRSVWLLRRELNRLNDRLLLGRLEWNEKLRKLFYNYTGFLLTDTDAEGFGELLQAAVAEMGEATEKVGRIARMELTPAERLIAAQELSDTIEELEAV